MSAAKFWTALAMAAALAVVGCQDDSGTRGGTAGGGGEGGQSLADSPLIASDGQVRVQVAGPDGAGPMMEMATADLRNAFLAITGASPPIDGVSYAAAVVAQIDESQLAELGDEGYRIQSGVVPDGRPGITVTGATEVGASYGLFQLAKDLGVQYFHPEETFTPEESFQRLPWGYDVETVHRPDYRLRGFHEHTQHPIPMSDYYLRPDEGDFRERTSRYLKWMARNRQNVASFHMLKTLDFDNWLPYIEDIADEAESYGIKLAVVASFVDQQQNNYKLIEEEVESSAEAQIRANLDQILSAGIDIVTFQIGSSEFTKPEDADVLNWLNTAVGHISSTWPQAEAFAWIHITCDLFADDDSYFFHLPLQASFDLGAYVHTTMYYTVDDPAPVYECENFQHQKEFMEASADQSLDAQRSLVWFPETAWWLGFDNNVPISLPITGWSRQYDVQTGISPYPIEGHVTFTTGREWLYWQYDHYVTELTWDNDRTWNDYLTDLAPLYGSQGAAIVGVIQAWTELQRLHFYEENPEIFFYVAGELPQDEIGEQAGILARRPKPSYGSIAAMNDAEFALWQTQDFEMLERMRGAYASPLLSLPTELTDGTNLQKLLYREAYETLWLTVKRIEHVIALYSSVVAVRGGDEQTARDLLDASRGLTEEVLPVLQAAEDRYRYPVEILARDKPDTLTAYPYGYLAETSTGFFWTRRDDQLEAFIDDSFGGTDEAWDKEPQVVFVAGAGSVTMQEPDDAIAASVIAAFIPRFLFGTRQNPAVNGEYFVLMAEDVNENNLPDAETEQEIEGALDAGLWTGIAETVTIQVRDTNGTLIGTLDLQNAELTFAAEELVPEDGDPTLELTGGTIAAELPSATLVSTIMAVGGIDEEGVTELVKSVYDLDPAEELPETLPLRFTLSLVALQ